ncbi:hypothetical protein B5807_04629 [Epicoccum nigrum]|jgi:hypothetical protein|uniref:Uncharacterized protein n=1 Tax=Epicoccum nigrum TaxID=105696 RepID=A0A1Y2M649_EPING|nr:hypothetical protein B5807_04629 [Epicoccum nigrum]
MLENDKILLQNNKDMLDILKELRHRPFPNQNNSATEINLSPLLQVSRTCVPKLDFKSPDALSKDQLDGNQATMKIFQTISSESSDTDMSCTDEEGEYVTAEEFAICAKQVQKMLRQISKVQRSLETHEVTGI